MSGENQPSKLAPEDVREALRIIRERQRATDALHAMELQLQMFEAQMATVYQAPQGWLIRDFTVGFEPGGSDDK